MADSSFFRLPRAVNDDSDPRASDPRGFDGIESDPHRPVPGHRRVPTSDPLSELARLIGQSDPFAAMRAHVNQARQEASDRPEFRSSPRPLEAGDHGDGAYGYRDGRDYEPEFARPYSSPAAEGRLSPDSVRRDSHDETALTADEAPHSVPAFGRPSDYSQRLYPGDEPELPDTGAGTEGNAPSAMQHHAPPATDDYAYSEGDAYEPGESDYDSEPGNDYQEGAAAAAKRRHALKLAVAVFGLAVFGSAAALGYRAVFKGGIQGPPPVIRADNSPTKVVPSGTSGDSGSKPINERLGEGSQERMVRREEDPVELRDPPRAFDANAGIPFAASGPAPFPPAASAAPAPPAAPPATGSASSAPPPAAPGTLTEPRRVRTVSIRADQGPPAAERMAPTRVASARTTVPATPASASTPAPASGGAPLTLTPQGVGAAAQTATAAEPPAAARTRSARPPDGTSFVVQLSAQKSEAEAEAAFRSMQTRYAILGSRHPLIRRKDQGERGVFYVAQVGPFGTRDEANQLCDSLKSVGGNCFVQKN